MKQLFLLAIAICMLSCSPKPLMTKYAIAYTARHSDWNHDGIVIASCEKQFTNAQAKVVVRNTIFKLENLYFDTAKIQVRDIRAVGNEVLDDGYRDAGLSCDCAK
jgi:hypothetical protein